MEWSRSAVSDEELSSGKDEGSSESDHTIKSNLTTFDNIYTITVIIMIAVDLFSYPQMFFS